MNPPVNVHKKRILFIINPISGVGRRNKLPGLIEKVAVRYDVVCTIAHSEYAGHAIRLAREAAQAGYDAVVAVGGDGSINEVAEGIAGTDCALGVIPAGSGNGLSHYLKIPFHKEKAISTIFAMRTTLIDTASINGRLFISVAGAGFDGRIAETFSHAHLRGFIAYAWMSVREYIFYQSKRYKIFVNGMTLKRKAFMLTFANSNQFGFNARIAPMASLNDGLLDLCIMKKPSLFAIPYFLPMLFLGKLHKTRYLEIIKTPEVRIFQLKSNVGHTDGDHHRFPREFLVKVHPLSLRIIVP